MAVYHRFCLMGAAACALSAPLAYAQAGDYYSRNKYTAVKERRQPDYDPAPKNVGAFLLHSELYAGLTATDNALSASTNEESDILLEAGVRARLVSNWNVHQIGASINASTRQYQDYSDESYDYVNTRVFGRLDVTNQIDLGAAAFFTDAAQSRTDPANVNNLSSPIEYTVTGLEGSANYRNDRVGWTNTVTLSQYDYEDGRTFAGDPVDQDFRDRDDLTARTRLSYAVSPNLAVYGQASISDRSFDNLSLVDGALRSRDSTSTTFAVGTDFELTTLVRGDVNVGFFNDNKDDSYFADTDGLFVDGNLTWFPTQLTTVSFDGGRRVVDSGVIESPTAVLTNFRGQVDHELRRNIILSGYAATSTYELQEVDRSDDVLQFGLSGTYKMNRHVHLEAFAERRERDRSGNAALVDRSFDVNELGIVVRFFP